MTSSTRETVVGGAALVALVLVLVLSYVGRDLAAKATVGDYLLKAVFNRVDGLAEGDEVHLGGIRVGSVDRLTLNANYQVTALLRIDSSVKLPRDTSVAIHTDGLFGTKFVILEPGGEMEVFTSGEEIEYTQDAVIVSELLELIIAEGKSNRKQ